MENEMQQEYFCKQCERGGEEIRAPKECPGPDNFLKIIQVVCSTGCKCHTFDYVSMKWWR